MLSLDQPLPVQYIQFVVKAFRGDFGDSLRYGRPALSVLAERWPASIQLGLAAFLLAMFVGIPAGALSALKRGSILDRFAMILVLIGQGAPVFWLGVMLILVFGVQLRWLPASGSGSLRHLVLPAITLGAFFTARVARFTRTAILDVLHEDYLRTARAKGLSEGRILLTHLAKNAAIPVVTVLGLTLPVLVGGSVITEVVFSWPGVGSMIIGAVYNRDYPLVQAGVFAIALFVMLVNVGVDVMYAYLNPRIRYGD
jgi:peptide/nickel transport system permease protein